MQSGQVALRMKIRHMARTAWLVVSVMVATALAVSVAVVSAQLGRTPFSGQFTHPAIQYGTRPVSDPVAALNRRLADGDVRLTLDRRFGYLPSVLDALDIHVESQLVAFAKTSVQSPRITPSNPRAIFFNDTVAVGWVRGGFIELAAQDPAQGAQFYVLDPRGDDRPMFERRDGICLSCHVSYSSLDVPGMLARSVFPASDGTAQYRFGSYITAHDSPFEHRWGGWYVTGRTGSMRHMGNAIVDDDADDPTTMITAETLNLPTLEGRFDTSAYLTPYSDAVALMVFDHQMHMMNLITRVGWETRYARDEEGLAGPLPAAPGAARASVANRIREPVRELVDYLLFVDEPPLPDPVEGTSGFASAFAARGPRDGAGRSLRDFDLERWLMRYPCSYMIYSDAFDGLPAEAREAIYARMWEILSGRDPDSVDPARYERLTEADRRAVVEILAATKSDLPDYFRPM
jgi:hypothetical protein